METLNKTMITVTTTVNAPVVKVWKLWSIPEHITKWNNASDDWYTPWVENDLKVGSKFVCRMEAKDGSSGFDFWGVYDVVKLYKLIEYTMGDGRKVAIRFSAQDDTTRIVETFEAENTNPIDIQKGGWQAILDNFKRYTESN